MQKNSPEMSDKKIYKLSPQNTFSYVIAGIVSDEKIFVLTNELNRIADLNLNELVSLSSIQNEIIKTYNAYKSSEDESGNAVVLMANRSSEGILFENFKNIDYMLIWSSEGKIKTDEEVIRKIKESKLVLGISLLTLNTGKEQKLILEIINQLR